MTNSHNHTEAMKASGPDIQWPTLTVVFEGRDMRIFFTHPEKVPMSQLNQMMQLVRRQLKTKQAQAFAELRKAERKAKVPPMVVEDVSTVEKPIPSNEDVLDSLIEDATTA